MGVDPDAEVVALSPKTLLESDRYVCEICNQGFQRDQNLQMHRRRHKVPWKLLKRETPEVRKRVFVCPEPSCLHHDPCHALGDLVGIKKHFRRKHSNHKQWVCEKCSKGYAVQSDYKAHLKTCGTRGHSCDCGRVFSRSCLLSSLISNYPIDFYLALVYEIQQGRWLHQANGFDWFYSLGLFQLIHHPLREKKNRKRITWFLAGFFKIIPCQHQKGKNKKTYLTLTPKNPN